MNDENFDDFCATFKIQNIKRTPLFKIAMTHSSVNKKKNYERIEFVGDSILNFCISKMLFEMLKDAREGVLSKKKSFLCSRQICRFVAQEIHLEKEIIFSKKQKISCLNNILSDTLESLIYVIYNEYGIEKVYEIVCALFSKYIDSTNSLDPKMCLQEATQRLYKKLPKYSLISKEGTEHEPMFKISVSCENLYAEGIGNNKKSAEKQAAEKLLSLINNKESTGGYFNPFK